MKCVILAGGFGTRISEESKLRPKPMVEVGGKPVLWHIMKIYSSHGVNDFVICLGFKGYVIKEYFLNYSLHSSDLTIDYAKKTLEYHNARAENWRVTLVDTGENTMTGGRLLRARKYLEDETFCLTYGDGLGDIDITSEIAFHNAQNVTATMTVVRPPGRFGSALIEGNRVKRFEEKPLHGESSINGGFFVLNPEIFSYLENDQTFLESDPLSRLARKEKLAAWVHSGFWQPMDTVRDMQYLEKLWQSGTPPWKIW